MGVGNVFCSRLLRLYDIYFMRLVTLYSSLLRICWRPKRMVKKIKILTVILRGLQFVMLPLHIVLYTKYKKMHSIPLNFVNKIESMLNTLPISLPPQSPPNIGRNYFPPFLLALTFPLLIQQLIRFVACPFYLYKAKEE